MKDAYRITHDGRLVCEVAGHVSRANVKRIATAIARHNPTLVHHGLAKGAAFHLTSTLSGPVADVYVAIPMLARSIAQLVSNALNEQVEITRNTLVGKGSVHARAGSRSPARGARGSFPSRNPSGAPDVGETWKTLAGSRARVLQVSSTRVQVLHTESGNREWIPRSEFVSAYRFQSAAPRRNPSRSPGARLDRKLKRKKSLLPRRAFRARAAGHKAKDRYHTARTLRRLSERTAVAQARRDREAGRTPNPKGRKRRDFGTTAFFERFSFVMPREAIEDLSGSGAKDEAAEHWAGRVVRPAAVTPERLAAELKEYGAWESDELADDAANWRRILWLAASNIAEEEKPGSNPRGGPRVVYNRLLGGWYVVTGPHQTPLNGLFNSKAEAQAWLAGGTARRTPNPKGRKQSRPAKNPGDGVSLHLVQFEGEWVAATDSGRSVLWFDSRRDAETFRERLLNDGNYHVDKDHEPGKGSRFMLRYDGPTPNPTRRNKSRSTRKNPASELERARRTAEMWNEFPATGGRRVKVKSRTIPKHLVKLGDLDAVVYRSKKYGGKPKLYEHRFKRPLPVLTSDPDGRAMHIVGGGYTITGDGLVN